MYVTPGSHQIMTKDSVISADGVESLVTKTDNHFCFCRPKAFTGRSATTWYSENVRVRHEYPSCLEADPSTIQGFETYSKDFRSVCAIIRYSCFQYLDMPEEGDLAKLSKAENFQHRIYELKRIEHFKVQLGMADDKLVDISTAEKDIFGKRIFPLVANLKDKLQSLVNLLKACQFSDVQLRESIDSIKASCIGLFEVLDDLKLPPVFQFNVILLMLDLVWGFQTLLYIFEMLKMQGCMALFIG